MSGRCSVSDHRGVLAIIPARQGSKRLPGKNMRPLAGKPMIQWTIEAARASTAVSAVLVTSDDGQILALAQAMGVTYVVPRPAVLATDGASTADVVRHAIATAACAGGTAASFCLLQPTSPLRTATDIDAAYALHRSSGKSVVSVCELDHPLEVCVTLDAKRDVRRLAQCCHLPAGVQRLNGAIYISEIERFVADGDFLAGATAHVMDRNRSVDVDTIDDFRLCEVLMNERIGSMVAP
jgi:CMP-N-acetylneuraminic acid synthetase